MIGWDTALLPPSEYFQALGITLTQKSWISFTFLIFRQTLFKNCHLFDSWLHKRIWII
jgi:hypothetical protein